MSDKCIFCNIANKCDPNTVIEFENENIVIFRDIRPAAESHFLAIPKVHIRDPKALTMEHIGLVNEMREKLDNLLKEKHPNLDPKEMSLGFHWPPFNSMKHLHMHGIAPVSTMGFIHRIIFKPNNKWYCTVDNVIDWIKAHDKRT